MADGAIEPRCLTRKEAAAYIGVSVWTFKRLESSGDLPPPIKISTRRLVWDKKALDEMIDSLGGF